MLPVTKKLAWGLTLIIPFSIVWGCTPDYRSASSKSKLDYWVPKDPWQNQKEGVCCFVYKEPLPEDLALAAAAEPAQPNRELENMKAALAAKEQEAETLRQQLRAAQSANAAVAKQLQAAPDKVAQAEPTLRLTQDSEKADLARQLQAAQAALQNENKDLARKLEDTRAALAQKEAREAEMERSIKSMEQALKSESGEKAGTVRRSGDSFTVELSDRILFDSGSATISPKGLKVVERIAESLKDGSGKIIRVEGHTDDVRIRKSPPPRFHSNWELSAARAGNVTQYLEKDGIKPDHLSAAGYSFTRPHVPNEDKASRALNRRVEIIVMPAPPSEAMLRRN